MAPFDANGDNAPDTVLVTAPTEPGGAPGVSVRLSGASPSTVALSAAAGSSFGFDIAVVDPDGPGGLAYRVAVSEPRRMIEGAQRGAVWFFDAVTGQSLGSWTSPEPASLRVGLRVQFVADQDLDGQADLLVEGARLHDGVWQPRVLLVSGANQRLLRESTAGFAESLAAVRAGVALFSPADVNGDGTVDGLDLLDIATHVGQTVAPYESGDLNGDGLVNAEDIHLATDQFVRGVRVHSPERLWNDSARVAEFDQVWGQAYLGNPGTPFVAPSAPASPLPASTGAESSTESPQFVQLEGENEEGEPFHPPQLLLSGPPATRSLNPWIGQYSCGEDLSQSCKLGSPDPANAWQAGIGWCLLEMQNCPSGPVGLNVGIPMPKATGTIQNLPGTQCVTEISQDGEHWFDVTGEDEALAGMPFVPANGGEFLMSTSIEGCVLVRIRCWNDTHDPNSPYRGCCACTQCAICSQGPEAPPCPIRIDILNPVDCTAYRYPDEEVASCQTPPESVCTVYRSSCDTVRLRAMAQPPGGFFSWTVNGYPYEYPGSPAEQAAAAQQNPNQIRLTPERLEETCQIVRVTYSLYEEGTLICEASRTIRIINDDLDCDDLTDDAELNVYGTDKNDSDTDDDGFCDGQEVLAGTNPLDHSSFPSGLASDIDGDGLADSKEEQTFLAAWPFGFPPQLATETVTSPVEFDTDHDGVQDLAELALGLDPVQRFLPPTPGVEANVWSPAGNSGTTRESDRFSAAYMAADRDQDLLFDEYERSVGMDPSDPDMDKDGIRDGLEIRDGTDPRASHRYESADTDGDGLSDYEEANFYGTDPNNADTDKDSLPDGFEIRAGLNPHTARTYSLTASGSGFGGIGQYVPASVLDIYVDLDGDGLNSLHEYAYGTDPLSPDTDNDGVDDKTEIIQTTSPLDPTDADQGLPRDQVCVVRITIGPHTHDRSGCDLFDPDFEHYTYDPIGDPASGEFVKRDYDWSISIGGGGSTGGPGITNPARLSTHDGGWAQLDVVLRKGQCLPITIGSARPTPSVSANPNYFLGAFPVEDLGGSRCLSCCCLSFYEPEHYQGQSTFFGGHCNLSMSQLEDPKTGYVCAGGVDIDIDSDNNNGFAPPERSSLEDALEDDDVKPGKVVFVKRTDADTDSVPDWADGNGAAATLGTPGPGSQQFVPVEIDIPRLPDLEHATIRFEYPLSDPDGVSTTGPFGVAPVTWHQYAPANDGTIRLWTKDGTEFRASSPLSSGGHLVRPEVDYPLSAFPTASSGKITLFLDSAKPDTALGGSSIHATLNGVTSACTTDKVRVTSADLVFHDLRHWGPRVNASTSAPELSDTDTNSEFPLSQPPIQGAIADGASPCLIRISPPTLVLSCKLTVQQLGFEYRDATDFFGAVIPLSNSNITLPALPISSGDELHCSSQSSVGVFVYVPPANYIDRVSQGDGGPSWGLNPGEETTLRFVLTHDNAALCESMFFLRRPPIVFVHGLNGAAADYWGSPLANENSDTPIPTRLYFVDYFPTNARGYDTNYMRVPQYIAKALFDYHESNDDTGPHHPWTSPGAFQHTKYRSLMGRRYAATRADIVAHSMGGQITRLYVSEFTGTIPRLWYPPGTPTVTPPATVNQGWPPFFVSRHAPGSVSPEDYQWFYKRDDNFGVGDIRRFIPIGSPFDGSPIATASLNSELGAPSGQAKREAIRDFLVSRNLDEPFSAKGYPYPPDPTRPPPTALYDLAEKSSVQLIMEGLSPAFFGGTGSPAAYPAGRPAVRWYPIAGRCPVNESGLLNVFYFGPEVAALTSHEYASPVGLSDSDAVVSTLSQFNAASFGTQQEYIAEQHAHNGSLGPSWLREAASDVIAREVSRILSGPESYTNTQGLDR